MAKIIILSGKARSGKDTACEIIKQYYQNEKVITVSYAYYLKNYLKRMNLYDKDKKPRKLMQEFGATLKSKLGNNFLINRVIDDIFIFSDYYDIIIITDARLKKEITIPKKHFDNVITMRIIRENYENGLTLEEKKDVTETDLDDYDEFDYIVFNDDNFEKNIRRCLDE